MFARTRLSLGAKLDATGALAERSFSAGASALSPAAGSVVPAVVVATVAGCGIWMQPAAMNMNTGRALSVGARRVMRAYTAHDEETPPTSEARAISPPLHEKSDHLVRCVFARSSR